jgi:hypothetical protein
MCPGQIRPRPSISARESSSATMSPATSRATCSRAAEQGVVGVDQALVAAPVGLQRRLRAGRARRIDVRVDVGAAERVDRLLRVADQHQRDVAAAERGPHDPPLHGVGVLELVDEHHVVAGAQAGGRGLSALARERVAQPREQVVVGHHRHAPLAGFELLPGGVGQPHPHRRDAVVGRVGRLDRGSRVLDRGTRDLHRLRAAELRHPAAVEAAHVEVVDDLLAQVRDVLDERGVGLDVADDAEAAQHLLAEAVRRGDRRGVEAGERAREPLAPRAHRVPVAGGEQRNDLVVRRRAGERALEPLLRAHQPLADALSQLARRHPRERHQQQLVQLNALGDVARGERRDRERLAGAGAGLEHGHAGRERAADVERSGRVHRCSTCSQSSAASQSRRA